MPRSAPVFSPDGNCLFFAASTNSAPTQEFPDMSTQERPYRAAIYAAVLAAGTDSPLKPGSGDEGEKNKADKGKEKSDDKKKETPPAKIDIDGLQDRIVAPPVAEANYSSLAAAKSGDLYFVRYGQPGDSVPPPDANESEGDELMKFDFDEKKLNDVMAGVVGAAVSADGEHLVVQMAKGRHH